MTSEDVSRIWTGAVNQLQPPLALPFPAGGDGGVRCYSFTAVPETDTMSIEPLAPTTS